MLVKIQVHYYEDESASTGTCAVCVVGGERLVHYKASFRNFFMRSMIFCCIIFCFIFSTNFLK